MVKNLTSKEMKLLGRVIDSAHCQIANDDWDWEFENRSGTYRTRAQTVKALRNIWVKVGQIGGTR